MSGIASAVVGGCRRPALPDQFVSIGAPHHLRVHSQRDGRVSVADLSLAVWEVVARGES
jgi:hypothetical protein